jgi:hypothetical protein
MIPFMKAEAFTRLIVAATVMSDGNSLIIRYWV